jgi:hypothetical protein
MASTKTRLSSNIRQQLLATGNVRSHESKHGLSTNVGEHRQRGNLMASHMNAILARRTSFHSEKTSS